ncbi:hypothetical protein [Litchfieldia salsa]|uniref:Uncharacterized protein n=1 Tax=Litchfieldia salsa TaxID=930152 RepID=A0A1H0T6L6_9BACI|nr:hypothetical protein [Litchfieldia salsa]SDP49238.1 hypothetical protein SAMN05216565_103295 [Litchfieldia salsa]
MKNSVRLPNTVNNRLELVEIPRKDLQCLSYLDVPTIYIPYPVIMRPIQQVIGTVQTIMVKLIART